MNRQRLIGLGMVAALTCGALAGYAALGQDNVAVAHNGLLILRVRVGAGELTAPQRASIIQARFHALMAEQFSLNGDGRVAEELHVTRQGALVAVTSPRGVVLTVTGDDALANNSDPEALAELWRNRLARILVIATSTG